MVTKTRKVRGAKLKRRWAKIFSGLTVLGVTLIYGAEYTTNVPQEMGKDVAIAMGV
jgi:hypothetical protein